ncbi:polynucleotide kinase 3 phosphatase-domain-containing protein [Syncephalis plumigaleata]|nr:polynucleotide kinase 3 phosphatase-domain-containing protein [Syncephalis plumigaleata]
MKRKSDKVTSSSEAESAKKKIHPFFTTPKTKLITWQDDQTLLYGHALQPTPRECIAAFDLDGTIFDVRGTHVHAKHADDWQWTFPCVPERVRQLHEDGYQIVFFSNQYGLRNTRKNGATNPKKQVFMEKLERVIAQLNVPVQIYAALEKDIHRKPRIGMWHRMIAHRNNTAVVDLTKSFYVGDAAGRPLGWSSGKHKDHSDCDRKFADNAGLPFYTPEEYFLKEKPVTFQFDGINPKEYMNRDFTILDKSTLLPSVEDSLELIVFTGMPASGKTRFYHKWFAPAGYVHINQDILHTKQKCIATTKLALQEGKSVVIDNTNASADARRDYIKLARDHDAKVRCFYFNADVALARHNNIYRAVTEPLELLEDMNEQAQLASSSSSPITASRQQRVSLLPDVAFHTYNARFVKPSIDEGFDEVKLIEFIPDFLSEAAKTAWMQWHI